ncbi:hypothetical protein [Sorangium sp. So ce590]|jgi:hypothetical protein|uniref:hypothetical protein n=1 Tax=unclassified Sorangium TaxID=2621164 RepID=UPI003F636472
MSDVGSARRAKDELKAKIAGEPWCVGVGVEREDGVGFIVRVSVRSGGAAAARAAIPERIGGVLIKVIENDP